MGFPKLVSIQPAATTTLSLPEMTTSIPNRSQTEISSRPSTDPPPVKAQSRITRQMISALNDIVVFTWIGLRVVLVAILLLIGFV